jgi:hypothetical protein
LSILSFLQSRCDEGRDKFRVSGDVDAVISWLESEEGLRWSWQHHKQTKNQTKMFHVKLDNEYGPDVIDRREWTDWGKAWTWGAQP